MPLQEADLTITSILEELQKDPNPVKNDKRPLRATGVALSVAVGLLETSFQNSGISHFKN
jgi:protein transport protein SEC23